MCFHLVIIMRCWEQTAHDTVWSERRDDSVQSPDLSLPLTSLLSHHLCLLQTAPLLTCRHFTFYTLHNVFHENCFTFSVKMCGAKHQMSRLTDWPNYNVNKYNVINKCGNIFIIGPQFTVYSL